jgi:hypothetical protein
VKKILSTLGLGGLLALLTMTGVVLAASLTTSTPPPVQGAKPLALAISSDTVSGPTGFSDASASCVQANLFKVGQTVVFRMWGTDVKAGGTPLTPTNVASAVVNIPNSPKPIAVPLAWVHEPYTQPVSKQVSYWEAHWQVPPGYPLGVINFHITVKTLKTKKLPVLTGTYSQKGFSSTSQLQVTT